MRALLCQLAPVDGAVEPNLARVERVLAEHTDVRLAVFPELFLQGYALDRLGQLACAVESDPIERVRSVAARWGTAVIVGFAERTPDGSTANSAVCVEADGTLAGVHRKSHLFGRGERDVFAEGEELLLAGLAGRRVGPLICFEMEFPEPARALARAGADLLVTIAANMCPYGEEHALAARARALDNRCPHLYVNRVGNHDGLEFVGGSAAIDSAGRATAGAGAGAGERLLEVEVPPVWVHVGSDIDYLEHGRRDLPVRETVPQIADGGGRR